jgi:uncharacterized protein involved in exopolysaccharide biosynthesis
VHRARADVKEIAMAITPQLETSSSEPRFTPENLLSIAWRYKFRVAAGMALGLLVSAAIGALVPRTFQSTAQISIQKKRAEGIDARNLAEENAAPPQDLLRSALIIDRAIQSKGLAALDIEVPPDQDLSEYIRNTLLIVPGKTPGLMTPSTVYKLSFRTRNPEDCQTVLTALLDTYKDFMDKKHQAVSQDTIELVLRDKRTLEKEIAEQDAAYRAFREKAPLLGKGRDGLELRQERLNSIQTRRSALLMQKIELEGQLAALENAIKDSQSRDLILAMLAEFIRKGDGVEAGRDRQGSVSDQLLPLLMEENKLVQQKGASSPEVAEIRKRIANTRRLMVLPATAWTTASEAETKEPIDPVNLHVQLLKQKLHQVEVADGQLACVFQADQDEARRLAAFEIQNDTFRTRITMNQQLYEALVKRLNDVSLIRNVGGYQIELLEAPSVGKRVAPSMVIALAIGAVVGLFLGLVMACRADARGAR